MNAFDGWLLKATAGLVARAMRGGWIDRQAILRDLHALRAIVCTVWCLTSILEFDVFHAVPILAASVLATMSSSEAFGCHRRIGTETDYRGWRAACDRAAILRRTGWPRRRADLVLTYLFTLPALSMFVVWCLAPGASFPTGIVAPALYFAILSAGDYVEATDPPPPSTQESSLGLGRVAAGT